MTKPSLNSRAGSSMRASKPRQDGEIPQTTGSTRKARESADLQKVTSPRFAFADKLTVSGNTPGHLMEKAVEDWLLPFANYSIS